MGLYGSSYDYIIHVAIIATSHVALITIFLPPLVGSLLLLNVPESDMGCLLCGRLWSEQYWVQCSFSECVESFLLAKWHGIRIQGCLGKLFEDDTVCSYSSSSKCACAGFVREKLNLPDCSLQPCHNRVHVGWMKSRRQYLFCMCEHTYYSEWRWEFSKKKQQRPEWHAKPYHNTLI